MRLHHNFYYRPHAFVGFVSLGILFFLFATFLLRVSEAVELDLAETQYNIAQTGVSIER